MDRSRLRRLVPLGFAIVLVLMAALLWTISSSSHRRLNLRVSTGQPGGLYTPMAEALASAVSSDHPRLRFEIMPGAGSAMGVRRLAEGKCDLAFLQNGTPADGSIRVLAPLYREVLHILVRTSSAFRTLNQLRGKRLAIGPVESGTQQVVAKLFEHYRLTEGSYQPTETDMEEACRLLLADEVDAVFVVAGIGAQAITDALATGNARLIGIGEATTTGGEVEGLQLRHPQLAPYLMPQNCYPDTAGELHPPHPIQTLSVPSLLVCRDDLPDRTARQIAASLFAHRASLIAAHPAAAQIAEPDGSENLAYPVHRGAADYYRRHEPGFLVTHAELIALVFSIALTIWGAAAGVRKWLQLRKKDRIDTYYVEIEGTLTRLAECEDLSRTDLQEIEATLSRLRHQAVQQLVAEKLLANESFRIFQVLLAHSQAEVRRQLEVTKQ